MIPIIFLIVNPFIILTKIIKGVTIKNINPTYLGKND